MTGLLAAGLPEVVQLQVLADLDSLILLISSLASSGMVVSAGLLYMRRSPLSTERTPEEPTSDTPVYVGSSQELDRLRLERDLLARAITRIYEEEAKGTLSQRQREQLASSYERRLREINSRIEKMEKYAQLEELERERKELNRLLEKRLGKIESGIEQFKQELGLKPKPKPKRKKPKPKKKKKKKKEKEKKAKEKPKEESELREMMDEMSEVMKEMEELEQEES